MSEALGIDKSSFAFFNASFFIGYVLFQIPGAAYASRRSARKLMFWALIFWGIIASLTAIIPALPNWLKDVAVLQGFAAFVKEHVLALLIIDRFLLGVVEGVVFPALLVLLTHWFTKRERSRANTLLILGNPLTMAGGSAVSGLLITYFDAHRVLGLRGWQLMLLCEGAPTLIWAAFWWFLVKDRPADAHWLAPEQAANVQAALDAEQAEVKHVPDYIAAFRDRRVILLCFQFFAWSIGIYALNMWLPVIVNEKTSLGMARVGVVNAIPYLLGATVMMTVSALSDRWLIRKTFVWPFLLIGAAAFLTSYLATPDPSALINASAPVRFPWVAFIGLTVAATCMYAPYGPFWAMIPEMVSRNVAGESAALINTCGAAGGFVGTYGVGYLNHRTGGYGASFACMSACLLVSAVLTLAVAVRKPGTKSEFLTIPVESDTPPETINL